MHAVNTQCRLCTGTVWGAQTKRDLFERYLCDKLVLLSNQLVVLQKGREAAPWLAPSENVFKPRSLKFVRNGLLTLIKACNEQKTLTSYFQSSNCFSTIIA